VEPGAAAGGLDADGGLSGCRGWRGVSDEEAVAQTLNGYLGPSWPAPPWDGDQVSTLAMCLEMAQEGAADS